MSGIDQKEKAKRLAEFLKSKSQLAPEDEPIFRRLIANFKIGQMLDILDAEFGRFRYFYEFFAKVLFNTLRPAYQGMPPEDVELMMMLPFTIFNTYVEQAVADLYKKKESGVMITERDIAESLYQALRQTVLDLGDLTRSLEQKKAKAQGQVKK